MHVTFFILFCVCVRAIKLIEKRLRRKEEEEMEKLIVVDFSALLCVRIIQIKVLVEKSYQQPSINSIYMKKGKSSVRIGCRLELSRKEYFQSSYNHPHVQAVQQELTIYSALS